MDNSVPNINSTKFGEITVNNKTYYSDLTIYWNGKISFRAKEHTFEAGEFMTLLRLSPEIIVIGAGQKGIITIAEEVKELAKMKKIDIYKDVTPKAVDIFNAFVSQGKKVVGIFHVTC